MNNLYTFLGTAYKLTTLKYHTFFSILLSEIGFIGGIIGIANFIIKALVSFEALLTRKRKSKNVEISKDIELNIQNPPTSSNRSKKIASAEMQRDQDFENFKKMMNEAYKKDLKQKAMTQNRHQRTNF